MITHMNTQPTMSSISMAGTLKNMLSTGFSTENCITEMIDDSLGAKATMIRLTLADNRLIVADNGTGMTCSKLREAHVLNNRSAASASKHGRFGIGRKHALVGLTLILAPVRTLTGAMEEGKIVHSEIVVDYPKVLRTDTMELTAHEITRSGDAEWQKHAIVPSGTGTITMIPLPLAKYAELKDLFANKDVRQSLLYMLGLTYHQLLASVTIEVVVEGVTQRVSAINPLAGATDTSVGTLKVYRSPATGDIRVFYNPTEGKEKGKWCRYLIHDNRQRSDNPEDLPGEEYMHLGDATLLSAYMDDWLPVQNPNFESMGLQTWNEGDEGVQHVRAFLGGSYIRRNGKIIHRTPAEIPKSNTSDKPTVDSYERSRLIIDFRPVVTDGEDDDLFTLDDVFNVQINKSKIDVAEIQKDVAFAIKKRFHAFRLAMRKKLEVAKLATATTLLATSITPPAAVTNASSVSVVPVTIAAVTASHSNSSVSPPSATVQPVAKVQRAASMVNVPVSDYALLGKIQGLAALLNGYDYEERMSEASDQAKPGNAALSAAIDKLLEFMTEQED